LKVVILAGGFGTRLAEETEKKPKPLVEIGQYPILWHIMKHFEHSGFNEFLIALGYKGEMIKKFFMDYLNYSYDLSISYSNGTVDTHGNVQEDWTIALVDTGLNTLTGGRVKRLEKWLKDEPFIVTYGDGVSSVDLPALVALHRSQGKIGTVTAVRPPSRFGGLSLEGNVVSEFIEKPQIGEGWINGGYIVFEPEVFNYMNSDRCSLEANVLEDLAGDGQLAAYRHEGFWQCMDTLRDVSLLREMWKTNDAPWKVWE